MKNRVHWNRLTKDNIKYIEILRFFNTICKRLFYQKILKEFFILIIKIFICYLVKVNYVLIWVEHIIQNIFILN